MVYQKIGIQFNNWTNMTTPTMSIPTTPQGWINQAVLTTNELTYGWFGFISMVATFLVLMWSFTDQTYAGEFRYSRIRGMGIASAITGIIGIFMLALGYFTNLYHVVIFIVITMISIIWVYLDKRA